MFIKVKHMLLILLIVLISVVFILNQFNIISKKDGLVEEKYNETTQNEEITRFNMKYTYLEMLKMLIEKNSDWSELPLSKKFREKYNSKDGIFGKTKFDKVEMHPRYGGKYAFEDTAYFVIIQGMKKTAYGYQYIFDNDKLDDVLLPNIYHITDENGNEMDYRLPIDEESFETRFGNLAFGGEHEQSVAVTDAFHEKYPYFLDLFIHYSPLGANQIEFDDKKSSWEKREAYFIVDSIYECVKRYYLVNFSLDERGYLDDASVKLLKEYQYGMFNELERASSQVFYKNSNWDVLKLTNNFKNKYKNKTSIFNDIDNVNPNKIYVDYINDEFEDMIIGACSLNDIMRWVFIDYNYTDDDYLDDVEILPIEYDGEDIEEAKEAYIKQYAK